MNKLDPRRKDLVELFDNFEIFISNTLLGGG